MHEKKRKQWDGECEIRDLWGTDIRHLYVSALHQTQKKAIMHAGIKGSRWGGDWHNVGGGDGSPNRDAEGISQIVGAAERMRKATSWE